MCHPDIPDGTDTPTVASEEIEIEVPSGERMPALLATPAGGSGPAVLIISDFYGRSPFYEHVAARLADAGYVALLPEPFFREGPLESHDGDLARARVRGWDQGRALADFLACLGALSAREEVTSSRLGTVGFCLGGTFVMHLACESDDLASVCFYGNPGTPPGPPRAGALPPLTDRVNEVNGPAIGIWGDAETVVDLADVEQFRTSLEARGVDYQQLIYPGLGHGFIARSGLDPANPDYELASDAWDKAMGFLADQLSPR